jgi:hypothetical protein
MDYGNVTEKAVPSKGGGLCHTWRRKKGERLKDGRVSQTAWILDTITTTGNK